MTDDTIIFTDDERAALCMERDCEEHADGSTECPIPSTQAEAQEQLNDQQTSESLLGDATPKTATGIVERADE